ncbi:MAG: hypothetical protein ACFFC7_04790 [Candidatus Hermodarchaeota archaeon]
MAIAFSWRRKEYAGLALISLAIGICAQLPILYHVFFIIQIAQEKNLLLLAGGCIGSSLILAALSAFLSESLPEMSGKDALTKEITRRNILDASLVVIFSYAVGYLIPMFIGYVAIPDFDTFIPELVFLIALGIGLLTAGITSYLVAVYRSSISSQT